MHGTAQRWLYIQYSRTHIHAHIQIRLRILIDLPLHCCALSDLRHRRVGLKHPHSERPVVSVTGELRVPFSLLCAGFEAS